MNKRSELAVSVFLWCLIGLGYVGFKHWHKTPVSSEPTRLVLDHFIYQPKLSSDANALAAEQPGFHVLLSRLRVNLADLNDDHYGDLVVLLKNRTTDELAWLDAHPDTPSDVFVDADNPSKGVSTGIQCYLGPALTAAPRGSCPLIASLQSGTYMYGAGYFPLDYVCEDAYTEADREACNKAAHPGWRVLVVDGQLRIYASSQEPRSRATGTLIYKYFYEALISMSVDWRIAFNALFWRTNPCGFSPSCGNSGLLSYHWDMHDPLKVIRMLDVGINPNDLIPGKVPLRYAQTTPIFINWGGDEFERALQLGYDIDVSRGGPEPFDSGFAVIPGGFDSFVLKHPQFFDEHPNWFREHPVWAERLKRTGLEYGEKIPKGPVTHEDVAEWIRIARRGPFGKP